VHLILGAPVVAAAFALTHEVWYPWGLFAAAGGRELFALVVGGVVAGPLLTLAVFVPGKKGLAFDLVTIAIVQLAALMYGLHVLYESRPAFLVFSKDRFELRRANEFEPAQFARSKEPYASLPTEGPMLVGAQLPTDREELDRLVFAAAGGVDISSLPRYYVPYDSVRQEAVKRAEPISKLRKLNAADAVDAQLRAVGLPEQDLRFLPVRAGKADLAALVDARRADVVRIVGLRPWEYQ
jgi:hypothetical protein